MTERNRFDLGHEKQEGGEAQICPVMDARVKLFGIIRVLICRENKSAPAALSCQNSALKW